MENNKESLNTQEAVFSKLMEAEKDVEAILNEIDELFGTTNDRQAAEMLVLKSYAPRLEEAQRKSREALENWLEFVRSEIGKE